MQQVVSRKEQCAWCRSSMNESNFFAKLWWARGLGALSGEPGAAISGATQTDGCLLVHQTCIREIF